MPSSRPRPLNLKAPPRKKRPAQKKAPRTPRAPREEGSSAAYWIIALLLVVLAALVLLCVEMPKVKDYLSGSEKPLPPENTPRDNDADQRRHSEAVAAAEEDKRLAHLQAKVETETRQLVERPNPEEKPLVPKPLVTTTPKVPPVSAPPAPKPLPPVAVVSPPEKPPVPLLNDSQSPVGQPPLVQPALANPTGVPARALPLDPTKLTTERVAAYQVALERRHFSCGFVDGDQGMRTQRMLRAFQASRGLAVTGVLDQPTRDAIGEPGEPFLNYTVTAEDVASIMPKPSTWKEKSQVPRLGYNEIWEMLAEKFHCTRAYLKALNPGVKTPIAGTEMVGPKIAPADPIPKAASIRILLSETSIEALDSGGKVVAFFPCSIAADKNKRPNGALTVKSVVPNPDYTFDPALFADAAAREGITHKMTLPPGPRNPVGTTWIGLSLPGYGMHGTPEPENISRTQSHGCFRLANWNAEKVLKMVKVGTPVDVEP